MNPVAIASVLPIITTEFRERYGNRADPSPAYKETCVLYPVLTRNPAFRVGNRFFRGSKQQPIKLSVSGQSKCNMSITKCGCRLLGISLTRIENCTIAFGTFPTQPVSGTFQPQLHE